jgi:hypothetical protein
MLNKDQHVSACAWFLPHHNSVKFEALRVRNSPLAHTDGSRNQLFRAVESEIASARREGLGYAEVGGWAATKESGCTSEGLVLALAGYSLARICGGVLGLTTATVRHRSSTILRRLGGSSLEVDGSSVPSYFDPTYQCTMELLRFDSRHPNAKYLGLIERLRERLANARVITKPASAGTSEPYDVSRRRSSFLPHVEAGELAATTTHPNVYAA